MGKETVKVLMSGRQGGKSRQQSLVNLVESDVPVRLPWKVTCGLACYAMIHKMTFDQVAAMALRAEMQRRERK